MPQIRLLPGGLELHFRRLGLKMYENYIRDSQKPYKNVVLSSEMVKVLNRKSVPSNGNIMSHDIILCLYTNFNI